MKHLTPNVLLVLGICLLLSACLKNTDVSVGGSIRIQPEYAIPIGSPELELGTYLNSLNSLNPIDTMQLDTLEGFLYENELYEIPDNIEYSTNVPFTLSGNTETDEYVTAAMFRTNATNKIPATILLQVYLLDAAEIIFDSLYIDGPIILEAAAVDDEGEVAGVFVLPSYDVYFDEAKLDRLTEVSSMTIYNKIIIEDAGNVLSKYYEDQDLWLQLAVKIDTDLKLND